MPVALAFHHVGVGTTDFDGAIAVYESLGHRLHARVDDPLIDIRVAFLAAPGSAGPWIEILSPLGPDGPLRSLIRRKQLPSPYHTCYAVTDLDAASGDLHALRFASLGPARPAVAFDGARVAFFYHASIGLIELVESPPAWPTA